MNNQQILFCQEYVTNGNNGTKAYMKAYPDSSYESAMSSCSDLLRNPKIKSYIEELQQVSEDKAIMSVQERKVWLSNLIKNKQETSNNKIKAIETLNKMDGVYTQKVEVQGDMKLNNPLRELTTDEIIEMINNEK